MMIASKSGSIRSNFANAARVETLVGGRRSLAVHPDDVLLAGDDARLDGGRVIRQPQHAVERDVLRGQQALEHFGVRVLADHAHDGDAPVNSRRLRATLAAPPGK